MSGRLPDFVVLGAPRCGTTSLFHYLREDNRFFLPDQKEILFFNDESLVHTEVDAYKAMFAGASASQRCGNITPQYSNTSLMGQAPQRIYEAIPNAPLVYVMRDPIDRAYSHYRLYYMRRRHIDEQMPPTFEAALAAWPWLVGTSTYIEVIERYLEYFPREQILFLLTEDLEHDANAVMREIQCHVGLEPRRVVRDRPQAHRTTDALRRHAIADKLRRNRATDWALDRVPRRARTVVYRAMGSSALGDRIAADGDVPAMLDATRHRLQESFAEPNRRLAAFLGRDLGHWCV